jgi:hypothetical protein
MRLNTRRRARPELPPSTLEIRTNDNMTDGLDAIRHLDHLRAFIHKTLCDRENILPDQFERNETPLLRGGRDCGLHFWVQGPRSVRLEAFWETERNIVFFYDARGNRFLKVELPERPAVRAA